MEINSTNKSEKVKPENPILKCSFLSKTTFWWLRDLFKIGMKRSINEDDIYDTLPKHKSCAISKKFMEVWAEELKRSSPSVLRLLVRIYGGRVFTVGIIYAIMELVMRIIQPLCLGGLVTYFASGQSDATTAGAYLYASGIIVSALFPAVFLHPFMLYMYQIGMKMRVGCCSLLYQKVLRVSKSTTFDGFNGQIINLMSNDVTKFDIAICYIQDLWKAPIEALVFGYFIYKEIGISAIIGMTFMIFLVPIQGWIGRAAARFRLKTAERTDIRVRFMNEIIQGIQVIKMFTWENLFAKLIEKTRKQEMKAIKGTLLIEAILISLEFASRLSIFLSLYFYIFFGNVITARKVFIVSSYFFILNITMVSYWPTAIITCAECYISVKRIKNFLLGNESSKKSLLNNSLRRKFEMGKDIEMDPLFNSVASNKILIQDSNHILLKNVSADWGTKDNKNLSGVLYSIDMEVRAGTLCAIIGPVGSGKSSLLHVILGELELSGGKIEVNGIVSYAPQEPWLFEGSIRSNIVFIEEFNAKRYNEVIKVCALERDLQLLPYGDRTICGERGVSLSGGQKARVSLARAIYKEADIYLLDDPLSAVDTLVGKHIFENCIQNYLADKICILVTHQIQFLKNVEHIVVMNTGRIEAQGSYKEIIQSDISSVLSLPHKEKDDSVVKQNNIENLEPSKENIIKDNPVEEREEQSIGAVSFEVYKSYFKSVDSIIIVSFVFLLFILAQLVMSYIDYFVAQWVNWEESNKNLKLENVVEEGNRTLIYNIGVEKSRKLYLYTYASLMAAMIYLMLHRTFSFFQLCFKASIKIHDKLFRGITNTTMWFFNNNASGRILNRFSRDIGVIDTQLPLTLIECFKFFLEFGSAMAVISIVNYWMVIPTIILSLLFYFVRRVYINTGREVKRIESLTRSPIFSHLNETLQGLSTIRAFQAHSVITKKFNTHLDLNSSAWFLYIATARAFSLSLDIICVFYVAVVTLSFFALGNETLGGNVGLAITQVISLIGMCQWGMRQTAELENYMVSVERIMEYSKLPAEPYTKPNGAQSDLPENWPDKGEITFKNLSLHYSESKDFVLKNVTFTIKSKEKVGIVGRTGAGKSSIIQALFRLAPTEGSIEIDEIDIMNLGLHDLRSKISIIPQDPVLFSGSLRTNLDPFEESKDEDMWRALESVELKQVVSSLNGVLNYKMSDGGANFSVGQRQLICLARAILRNNRILILDEATANVDPETDKLIQTTIRKEFSDCTVLTIAHRLHTVMDSDKVLVMDAGRVVEFAHPFELLQIEDGHLKALIDETEPTYAACLMVMAKNNYNKMVEIII